MYCDIKILFIYILVKIYKIYFKLYVVMEIIDLNREV